MIAAVIVETLERHRVHTPPPIYLTAAEMAAVSSWAGGRKGTENTNKRERVPLALALEHPTTRS